jgi:chromosome segregation ATPase
MKIEMTSAELQPIFDSIKTAAQQTAEYKFQFNQAQNKLAEAENKVYSATDAAELKFKQEIKDFKKKITELEAAATKFESDKIKLTDKAEVAEAKANKLKDDLEKTKAISTGAAFWNGNRAKLSKLLKLTSIKEDNMEQVVEAINALTGSTSHDEALEIANGKFDGSAFKQEAKEAKSTLGDLIKQKLGNSIPGHKVDEALEF